MLYCEWKNKAKQNKTNRSKCEAKPNHFLLGTTCFFLFWVSLYSSVFHHSIVMCHYLTPFLYTVTSYLREEKKILPTHAIFWGRVFLLSLLSVTQHAHTTSQGSVCPTLMDAYKWLCGCNLCISMLWCQRALWTDKWDSQGGLDSQVSLTSSLPF